MKGRRSDIDSRRRKERKERERERENRGKEEGGKGGKVKATSMIEFLIIPRMMKRME